MVFFSSCAEVCLSEPFALSWSFPGDFPGLAKLTFLSSHGSSPMLGQLIYSLVVSQPSMPPHYVRSLCSGGQTKWEAGFYLETSFCSALLKDLISLFQNVLENWQCLRPELLGFLLHEEEQFQNLKGFVVRNLPFLSQRDCRECTHMLLHLPEKFLELRSSTHLLKFLTTFLHFKKTLIKEPANHRILFRPYRFSLKLPFGVRKRTALLLASAGLSEYARIEKKHLQFALKEILHGISFSFESFFSFKSLNSNFRFFYCEIEKDGGKPFSQEEISLLKKDFPSEVHNNIEFVAPALFAPPNEEEIYKNILLLSAELEKSKKIPQAILSFQHQTATTVKFNVILLRALFPESSSLSSAFSALPSNMTFMLEKTVQLGLLEKKFPKEANVFTIEIPIEPFLCGHQQVNLLRMRHYLASLVHTYVGPFRDYNGGLFQKQNEHLEELKKKLGPLKRFQDFALESFFYSLSPRTSQSCLDLELLAPFASHFLKTLNLDTYEERGFCFLEKEVLEGYYCCTLKAKVANRLNFFHKALHVSPLFEELSCSVLEYDSHLYVNILAPIARKSEIDLLNKKIFQLCHNESNRIHDFIRFPLSDLPDSLHPHIGSDLNSRMIQMALYEGLTRMGGKGKVLLAGAGSVDISSCGRHYTFFLRKNFWSNGSPVTAFDYERGWKQAVAPSSPCMKIESFFILFNAKKIYEKLLPVEELGVRAVDENTLQVQLEHSSDTFLELVSNPLFCPLPKEGSIPAVVNGPFQLKEWIHGKRIVLSKNPYFWDAGPVRIEEIEFFHLEQELTLHLLFKERKIDGIYDPFFSMPSPLEKHPCFASVSLDALFLIYFNTLQFPFNSSHIRKALASALDRTTLIEHARLKGKESLSFFDAPAAHPMQKYDPEKAYHLFLQGMLELDVPKEKKITFQLSYPTLKGSRDIMFELKRQWESVLPVKVRLEEKPWKIYSSNLGMQRFHVGGCVLFFWNQDPLAFLRYFENAHHCFNFSRWEDPEYGKLIQCLENGKNSIEREKLIGQAESILFDQMPCIPVFIPRMDYIFQKSLKEIIVLKSGHVDFRWAFRVNQTKKRK